VHTSVIHAAPKSAAARYFGCLRAADVVALQGTPLVGALFALRHTAAAQWEHLFVLVAGNVCLIAHVFALNDWSNVAADLADPHKAPGVFLARGVGHRQMGALTAGLLFLSLALFGRFGETTLGLAVAVAALSALYSLPPFAWKARPVLSSLAHVAGGALHFLLGYSLAARIDRAGVAAAMFFAVTFAAGHLAQEVRDYDGDVRNGIRTHAVVFGKRRTFAASLAVFAVSHALLVLVIVESRLPRAFLVLVLLYPVQLLWSRQARDEGLTFASVRRLQGRYRALYALIGAALAGALWLQ
jgi:4-hydroxybenzoate polyprenyltransferase